MIRPCVKKTGTWVACCPCKCAQCLCTCGLDSCGDCLDDTRKHARCVCWCCIIFLLAVAVSLIVAYMYAAEYVARWWLPHNMEWDPLFALRGGYLLIYVPEDNTTLSPTQSPTSLALPAVPFV